MPWYRVYKSAEGDSVAAVELTSEEFQIVKKFFDSLDWFYSESYSGHMGIHDTEYESKEEIVKECKESSWYSRDCFSDYEETEEDDRECCTCRYRNKSANSPPCNGCWGGDEWEQDLNLISRKD